MEKETLSKGQNRKIQILNKAVELFNESGFHNVTFQAIADELSITQPNIFYYYKTKEDLLQGCIEHIIINNKRVSSPFKVGDKIDQIKFLCKGTLDWALHYPAEPHLILFLNYNAIFNNKFKDINLSLINKGVERVLDILDKRTPNNISNARILQRYCYGSIFQIITAKNPTQEYETCLGEVLKMIASMKFD